MVAVPSSSAQPNVASAGASTPFGKHPILTFLLAIGLPALVLCAACAVMLLMGLGQMADEMNRVERARGLASVHAAVDAFLNDLSSTVAEQGGSDEAYSKAVEQADTDWMDATWGATARLGQMFDTVAVTDQTGAILFGEGPKGEISGTIAQLYPSAATMLGNLGRSVPATTNATTAAQFAADTQGTVGLAAITIHRTSPGEQLADQNRRILWIARHMSSGLLQSIAVRYQTPLAAFGEPQGEDTPSLQLADADGKPVGTLSWTADRPGDAALSLVLPQFGVDLAGVGCAVAIWLWLVWCAFRHRAAVATVAGGAMAAAAPADETESLSAPPDGEQGSPDVLTGVSAADFTIEYQPVFDLRSETLVGVEALLRWTGADKAVLTQEELGPGDLARLLERIGAIAIRRAADDIAPLLGIRLSIAVTPSLLRSSVFVEKVGGTLAATRFPAGRLQLALHCALLPDVERLRGPIAELRQLGVLIALDDFAISAPAARYLDAALIDRVRLAPSLAADADRPAGGAYIAACIDAARIANLAVTVPGLERKEQAVRLLRMGCREFQGNLLARPMPLGALTQLVLAPPKPDAIRKAS